MTSFQSSELTELPVVENSQLFAQRVHSACTAHGTPPQSSLPEQPQSQASHIPKSLEHGTHGLNFGWREKSLRGEEVV